jgi:hypothetical protein
MVIPIKRSWIENMNTRDKVRWELSRARKELASEKSELNQAYLKGKIQALQDWLDYQYGKSA